MPHVQHSHEHISRTGVEHASARYQPPLPHEKAIPAALQMAGRAIFGGYFIYNAVNHFRNREMLAGYARSRGVPLPEIAVVGTGVMMLLGGLSLLTGTKPKVGAGLISGFLAAVSPTMHGFWRDADQTQRMDNSVHFMKNLALAGGALLAAAVPEPWPASLHARRPS
jgi:putative oxidoreductase